MADSVPHRVSSGGAVGRVLDDGRLHLQHGPIDLIIGIDGEPGAIEAAHRRAWSAFEPLLAGLVAHVPALRRELPWRASRQPSGGATDGRSDAASGGSAVADGRPGAARGLSDLAHTAPEPAIAGDAPGDRVARMMIAACWPHRHLRLTPMAAVAGSVAAMVCDAIACESWSGAAQEGRAGTGRPVAAAPGIVRAWVNNGGDIAAFLSEGTELRVAVAGGGDTGAPVVIGAHDPVRGIATSGRHGRSFSLGIADAVTVLAADAPAADAAATLIANAVNLESGPIERRPARELAPDSDLGERLVTVAVGPLRRRQVEDALSAGAALACAMIDQGLIVSARLALQGQVRVAG
ncbi:MAG: UPF0280 family protein [Burkholderiaceae bacterium]